jgi:UDPglucose 6-dehydrogenase
MDGFTMEDILVIGSGVVGQATGKGFSKKGHTVSYVDVNPDMREDLRREGLTALSYKEVEWHNVDIVMVCVDTPTGSEGINLEPLRLALEKIGRGLAETEHYLDIIIRSTVLPRTTDNFARNILETYSGSRLGERFGLGHNPEFLRHRSSQTDFDNPWIIVYGAIGERTIQRMRELYAPFNAPVVECSPTEAELIKYVHNIYNAVKISYFNEVHRACEYFSIDSKIVSETVAQSAEGIWNPRYGIRGGYPYSGGCLPKDTRAFHFFCQELGLKTRILDAAIMVNEEIGGA